MVGDQFSAADVMIGSTLAWGMFMDLLGDQPVLLEYVQGLSARPAFEKSQSL